MSVFCTLNWLLSYQVCGKLNTINETLDFGQRNEEIPHGFAHFVLFFSKRNLISIETLYLKRNYCKVYLSSVNYALDLKETDNKIE